ncbi:MAG: 50S ribosomal protein L21 [Parachlamydiaceae bacterium]|nr:50S ribosomal protein L21 [Parachlamydiaceae bacterium]
MYAIIQTGGKQYKVAPGDFIDVELLEANLGDQLQFDVLFVNDGTSLLIGAPLVEGAVVRGELLDWVGGPKVTSVKYKRSHHQYRKFGHRQKYCRVKITEVSGVLATV